MQVTILVYRPGSELEIYQGLKDLKHCAPENSVWVDLQSDDPEELRIIASHFRLHELTIEDCFTPGHFPKVEDFGNYLFCIFRSIKTGPELEQIWSHTLNDEETLSEETWDRDNEEIYTRKVAVYLSEKFLITFRRREVPWLDAVLRQVTQIPDKTIGIGSDVLIYRVTDVLTDRFSRGVGFFERLIDRLEDSAIEDPDVFKISDILTLKKDLTSMRQLMREQRSVIARVAADDDLIRENQRKYFRDIDDHALSIVKSLDKEIEALLALRDTYFAMANVRLGDTMRILAIITTIAAPLNIIVGLYGMNMQALPLGHHPFGFWIILALMLCLSILMIVVFRKKHWF